MYFIEFLVQRKLIDEERMADALAEQASRSPSLYEVARTHRLIPSRDLVSVAVLQARERLDFRAACARVGVWSPELERAFDEKLRESEVPISRILLSRQWIGYPELNRALDEYLLEAVASTGKEEGTAALVSAPAASESGDAIEDELRRLFSPEAEARLLEMTARLAGAGAKSGSPLPDGSREDLRQLLHAFHELRGACRLAQRQDLEMPLEKAEALVQEAIARWEGIDAGLLQSIGECLGRAVKAFWKRHGFFLSETEPPEDWRREISEVGTQLELFLDLIGTLASLSGRKEAA